jgi:hypothetical protein
MHTLAQQTAEKSYPRMLGNIYVRPRSLPFGDRTQHIKALTDIGVGIFKAALAGSADHTAPFRMLMTTQVGGESKPLLVVGTAHGYVEDGSIVVVLNPERGLVDQLNGSSGAYPVIFREIVQKRCDAAVSLWIDVYRRNGVIESASYVSRTAAPARFSV